MKRKLRLLNEVLPRPESASRSSPRSRVLRHAAGIVSGAAALATAVSCRYGVVDPLPSPGEIPSPIDGGPDAERSDAIVAHPTVDAGADTADARGDTSTGEDANADADATDAAAETGGDQ